MSKTKSTPATALAEAHRVLLKDLAAVERYTQLTSPAPAAEVRRRLEALRSHLGKHFRFEEENGYMQAVLARAPHQERRVRQLREEHTELWQLLTGLVEMAAALPELDDTFRQKLHAWLMRVQDHEIRENVLVEDTFNVEVSAAD